MAMDRYLAMTPGELAKHPNISAKTAWMACHFSSSGTGISNLPQALPEGSMLILDDSTPFNSHDPAVISRELRQAVEESGAQSVLLDLQRTVVPQVKELAEALASSLPCPLGITAPYARELNCAVFLPPLPLNQSLEEYLSPYASRKVWLDMAPGWGQLHILPQGNRYLPLPANAFVPGPFRNDILRCRYSAAVTEDGVVFSLFRGAEELQMLLEDAQKLGVEAVLGLYQELASLSAFSSF